ncbi:MAG: hypothetical protein MJ220_01545 [Bacilli bacterium]|nr:hypothetical protein [Bacilli bacterium]
MKVGKLIGGLVTVAVIAVGGYLLWQSGMLSKMVPEVDTDCKSLLDKVKNKDTSKYVEAVVEYNHSDKGKGTYTYTRDDSGKFVCSDENNPTVVSLSLNTTLAETLELINNNYSDAELKEEYKFKTGLDTYTVSHEVHTKAEDVDMGDGIIIHLDKSDSTTEVKYNTDGMVTSSYSKSTYGTKTSTEEYSVKWTTK